MALPVLIQCRGTFELKSGIDKAAADCAMTAGTWMREVLKAAIEQHEEYEAELLDAHQQGRPLPTDPDYQERVEEEARVERERLHAEQQQSRRDRRKDKKERVLPRECPHLPSMRGVSGKCNRCGTPVGRLLTASHRR